MISIIGIMAMVGGFIGIAIKHYDGATCCFLFALILWNVLLIDKFKKGGSK